jgi:ketosteroid isomerase-like protein
VSQAAVTPSRTADYRAAFEARNLDAVMATLSPQVVLHSPITRRFRFEGHQQVRPLLGDILDMLEKEEWTGELSNGDLTALVADTRIAGNELRQVVLLRFDSDGRIGEITVYMRPLPAVAGLAAALGPRLARRKGRVRGALVGAFIRPLAAVIRFADRAGAPLARP